MMRALLARELLAWHSGAEILNPWFFLIVITLFPFGVGAAARSFAGAQIAPGVVNGRRAAGGALLVMDRFVSRRLAGRFHWSN